MVTGERERRREGERLTLKNVWKAYDCDAISKQNARNVLIPPFNTAGPISVNAAKARSEKIKCKS